MKKLLVHLRSNNPSALDTALNYLSNFTEGTDGEGAAVLLVNGPAVTFFKKSSQYGQRIRNLMAPNIIIELCEHALRHADIPKTELLEGCRTVPFGIVALADWQSRQYAYVKA